MTPDDVRSLREFFDSPEGKRVLGQIQASMEVQPLTERRGDNFWRASPPGAAPYPLEVELTNETPLDALKPFPKPAESEAARRVSLNHAMLVTWICCALGLGGWLVWVVVATIRSHA